MKWYTRSCERPRKRSVREALPSSVSNRYALSIRTHGSSWRRRASPSLRRVISFSAWSSSIRAASHSSRVPVLCLVIALSPSFECSPRIRRPGSRSRDTLCAGYRRDGSDKCDGIPMDALIAAAARALSAGDPLRALNRVALRDDAPALALRGIAMAQLGDLVRARALLRRAGRAFGPADVVASARCAVAEAEIAFASRDLGWSAKALAAARAMLEAHGDRVNASYARHLEARRLLLVGHVGEAERAAATL